MVEHESLELLYDGVYFFLKNYLLKQKYCSFFNYEELDELTLNIVTKSF